MTINNMPQFNLGEKIYAVCNKQENSEEEALKGCLLQYTGLPSLYFTLKDSYGKKNYTYGTEKPEEVCSPFSLRVFKSTITMRPPSAISINRVAAASSGKCLFFFIWKIPVL